MPRNRKLEDGKRCQWNGVIDSSVKTQFNSEFVQFWNFGEFCSQNAMNVSDNGQRILVDQKPKDQLLSRENQMHLRKIEKEQLYSIEQITGHQMTLDSPLPKHLGQLATSLLSINASTGINEPWVQNGLAKTFKILQIRR